MVKRQENDAVSELDAIRDAMDKTTGGGRDYDAACKLADTYVETHPLEFDQMRNKTIEELTYAVSVYRAAGMFDDQWKVETWILHHFNPLNVGGPFEAQVRIPN